MLPAPFTARRHRIPRRLLLRRGISAMLLLTYVVVAAGIPLPAIRKTSSTSELYPCATCACGCDSAEHCWRTCCCHTLAQRLAWATKNGVKPPDFALVAARAAGLDASGQPIANVVTATFATKTCCHSKRACCTTNSKSCCSSHADRSKEREEKSNVIVAWRAMSCHGQSLNWLAAVPSLITVEPQRTDHLALVAWLGPCSSEFASPHSDTPTPPPPERA
jgi:hypothetical protein